MNTPSQLTEYDRALLKRDEEFHAHQQERLARYRMRGVLAGNDLQIALRHDMALSTKTWSASCQTWFSAWLMLKNPVIGRKCIILAPSRQ